MIVLFTGSRELKLEDRGVIADGLREVVGDDPGPHTLFHGDARGGDRLAAWIASSWGWKVREFAADWYGPCRPTCQPGHRRTRPGETRSYCPGWPCTSAARRTAAPPTAAGGLLPLAST
jgi:hypothetical protein